MHAAQKKTLWQKAYSEDETIRKSALADLVQVLRNKPRNTLTAEQLDVVRTWEAAYRQRRRMASGDALRKKHRDYCREKVKNSPQYRQKRKDYRLAHKQSAKENLAAWKQANPDRAALHRAREMAKRQGMEPPHLGEEFALRLARQRDYNAASDAVQKLAGFLENGTKSRDECMQFLNMTSSDAFDEFLLIATHALPALWEDDDGSLGLDS